MNKDVIVQLKNIVKIYGGHAVLKRVSFDLRAGEVHCVVGENGAGKSTLIKILSGAVVPEEGEIYVLGKRLRALTPRLAINLGISTVYQDAELVDSLTVAENIFLGSEKLSSFPIVIDKKKQNQEARYILQKLGVDLDPDLVVEDLSAAQRQIVQIAKALFRKAKVIIFDEPTSSLGMEETKALMKIIQNLKMQGIGIIYISHYLREIFEIGDRVTILKDGENMGTYDINEIDIETVVKKMVGRDVALFFQRKPIKLGEVQVQIRNLSKDNIVKNVSFDVKSGEIFGIGGLVGSGRTELVSLIFGIKKPDSGEIIIRGKKVRIRSPMDAIRNGICFVPEDRKKYAMFLGRNVVENAVVVINELLKQYLLRLRQEIKLTADLIKKLSIVVSSKDQLIEELSGGNQQKVIAGRWLLNSEAVLYIFDEPTKGVDIGAREQIYELMLELAERGKSIIMVSSDMPELLSMSDRIGIMRKGEMVEILENKGLKEEELLKYFIGV